MARSTLSPPDSIARQTTLIAWMLAGTNGLTTWQIAQQWQNNPGTTAILNRLHRLQRLGFVEEVVREGECKLYRWKNTQTGEQK